MDDTTALCFECGVTVEGGNALCSTCALRWPPSLAKAAMDDFDYALRLRTGEEVRFSFARLNGNWVHLTGVRMNDSRSVGHSFERGLDVRLTDIVWCADAPDGS